MRLAADGGIDWRNAEAALFCIRCVQQCKARKGRPSPGDPKSMRPSPGLHLANKLQSIIKQGSAQMCPRRWRCRHGGAADLLAAAATAACAAAHAGDDAFSVCGLARSIAAAERVRGAATPAAAAPRPRSVSPSSWLAVTACCDMHTGQESAYIAQPVYDHAVVHLCLQRSATAPPPALQPQPSVTCVMPARGSWPPTGTWWPPCTTACRRRAARHRRL